MNIIRYFYTKKITNVRDDNGFWQALLQVIFINEFSYWVIYPLCNIV